MRGNPRDRIAGRRTDADWDRIEHVIASVLRRGWPETGAVDTAKARPDTTPRKA